MDKRPIGMMDSGLGGLSVLRVLQREMPNESLIFVGDQGHFPYGTKSQAEIRQLASAVGRFLQEKGAKMMVIACNTATAAALPTLQKQLSIPVIGVIKPGAQAALASGAQTIGVIGTESTIKNGAYDHAIKDLTTANIRVVSQAAQPLVSIVEHGQTGTVAAQRTVDQELAPLKGQGVQTLVQGCTQFPFQKKEIEHTLGPTVKLDDPAFETVKHVQAALEANGGENTGHAPVVELYTTGKTADLVSGAQLWLSGQYDSCSHIDLEVTK